MVGLPSGCTQLFLQPQFTPHREHTVILYARRLLVSSASLLTLHGHRVWLTQSFIHAKGITNVKINWKCWERGGRGLSYGTIRKSAFRYSENTIKILVTIMPQPRFEPRTCVYVKTFAAWANLFGPNITKRHLTQWSTYSRTDCGCKSYCISLLFTSKSIFCWPVEETKFVLLYDILIC